MKRCVDLLIALAGVLALWPALLLIAALIRRDSPGPALYRQTRIGRGGRTFEIYKFRSMVVDGHKVGPPTTQDQDPRITRIGRVLRRTSLDELPQLLNVLKGDMSLVGPRPELPLQRANYSEGEWALRHRVRPGLTGLAQVNGRHSVDPADRKAMDLRYVRQVGVALDLRIFILTLREVLLRGSA
ncbi:MAG TPA: sugar transferase [Planctomycetota bacterium]